MKDYLLAFLDFEFNPKTKIPTEIGISLSSGEEYYKKDLQDIAFNLVMEEIHKFLPKTNICFVYFGQQEVNILNTLFRKNKKMPQHISSLYNVMLNGVNVIEKFPFLSSYPLYELVKDLRADFFSPAHQALNDAKNLQSLYKVLTNKNSKPVVDLLSKNRQIDKSELNRQFQISQNSLRNAVISSAKKVAKKSNSKEKAPENMECFINERTGEKFYVTRLSKPLEADFIYNIKLDFIGGYNGASKDLIIYLIEHYNAPENNIKVNIPDICSAIGISAAEVKNLLIQLENDNLIFRLGKLEYQFICELNLLDKKSFRKILFSENKKTIRILV